LASGFLAGTRQTLPQEGNPIVQVASLFNQLLQHFPRSEFAALVKKHAAERDAKGFTCWTQFVSMLFCQLGRADSLREICNGLGCCLGRLVHVGILRAPCRVSLRSFWRSDSCRCIVVNCRIGLSSEAEQPGDEETLAHRIPFCQPPHSALPNHVYSSIPCSVRQAVRKEPYPFASHTRFFTVRWSCSITLLRYLH
jgi:hypothetical protein